MIKFTPKPNPNIEWIIGEYRDGYSAWWALYKDRYWHGLMIRMTHSTGHTEEPLPVWIIAV